MWYDDEENLGEIDYDDNNNWEIKINENHHKFFEIKDDAVEEIIDYLEEIIDNKLNECLSVLCLEDITNTDDLYDVLIASDSVLFFDIIDNIIEYYNIDVDINLINYDGEDSSFCEL